MFLTIFHLQHKRSSSWLIESFLEVSTKNDECSPFYVGAHGDVVTNIVVTFLTHSLDVRVIFLCRMVLVKAEYMK